MRCDGAAQILTEYQAEQRRLCMKSLALFGSVARDQARPDSAVDILVEFDGPATFDGYMDLGFFLEGLLHAEVKLVTQSLRPEITPGVERDLVRVTQRPHTSAEYPNRMRSDHRILQRAVI